MTLKRFLVGLAVVSAFILGYGGVAWAYPSGGVYGRSEHRGYFTNTHDEWGTFVLPAEYSGEAFRQTVDTADEFISFIKYTQLDTDGNGSSNQQEKTGAAFIVQTMIGSSRNKPPTAAQIADWEARVRLAESQGRISWFYNYTYNLNSYYQGPHGGGATDDDAFYDDNGTSSTIVFRNASGQIIYAIRRQCANPVSNGTITPLPTNFNMTGRTTVSSSTVEPGQNVTFSHYLRNSGPHTTTVNINWVALDQNDNQTAGSASSGTYTANQEKNVHNEVVAIPANAAAGTQYCRKVGYDPVNNTGGRHGRGALACTTVVIPAKLKAAMSVAPPFMVGGDTATFTPTISATTNTTPVNVNCSITRTLYPPSGAPSSLGAQPCVTNTGDSNIVIGTGASVILRPNQYAAPDNIPIGTRICDVITITNPAAASYYTNYPADQTATACVTIAKSPYVHFNGDVWAGGGFAAVTPACDNAAAIATVNRGRTISDGTMPGSGTTHGAFALGRITGFGSAGMGLITASGVGKAWTFSNHDTANLGFFGGPPHCITDHVSTYQSAPLLSPGSINVSGGTSGQWRINGNASFQGPMTQGAKKVYLVYGDVTITDNITYTGAYTSVSQLPSLVIIATGNINVSANVTQIDGIFISRGTFYTCYPKPEPATLATCNSKLTINGSVSASTIDLFRTAGAEAGSPAQQKEAAEVFNLSPEVFLNNALNTTSGMTITTNDVRELPPRF